MNIQQYKFLILKLLAAIQGPQSNDWVIGYPRHHVTLTEAKRYNEVTARGESDVSTGLELLPCLD